MLLQIYSVYDMQAAAYTRPFFVRSRGEAVRSLMNEVQNKESPISQYPHDFCLMHLGEYQDETGEFVPMGPEKVMTCLEAVELIKALHE